jgi:hypothetical protein
MHHIDMRIYHIGLPKTGTTSLQFALQTNPRYLGTFQPRAGNKSKEPYKALTNFLLGKSDDIGLELPESFIYSEEEILVNGTENKVIDNLNRLFSILQPEDRILISTRQTESAVVSAYYEFYRFLEHTPLDEVMQTCWLKPYEPGYIESIIPLDLRAQVIFGSLENLYDDFRGVFDESVFRQLLENEPKNKRKVIEHSVEVTYYWRPFPPALSLSIDAWLWNPICKLPLFQLRENLFQSYQVRRKRLIPRVSPQDFLRKTELYDRAY